MAMFVVAAAVLFLAMVAGVILLAIGLGTRRKGVWIGGVCALAFCMLSVPLVAVAFVFRGAVLAESDQMWQQIAADSGPILQVDMPDFETATGIKLPPSAISGGQMSMESLGGPAIMEIIIVPEGFGATLSARFQAATPAQALAHMPGSADIIDMEGASRMLFYTLTCKDAEGAAYRGLILYQPDEDLLTFYIQPAEPRGSNLLAPTP